MRSDKYKDIEVSGKVIESASAETEVVDLAHEANQSKKDKKDKMSKKTKKKVKRNGAMDWAFRVIIFCLVCVIGISGYKVGTALYKYHHSRSGFKQVAKESVYGCGGFCSSSEG